MVRLGVTLLSLNQISNDYKTKIIHYAPFAQFFSLFFSHYIILFRNMHRLEKYIADNKLSLRELADTVGVHYATLSRVIHGHIGVSVALSNKIRVATGIFIEPNRKGSEIGADRIKHLKRSIDEKERQLGIEPNLKPFDMDTDNKANMYIVPVKAFGGFVAGYESPVFLENLEKSNFPWIKGECYAFEVDGYSMYKEYAPGDFVITTPVESLEWLLKGKVYVFQTVDGILLKCFERIEDEQLYLSSINEEYNPVPPIHLKDVKKVYFKEKTIK